MSGLKRSIPLIERGCKASCSRNFHAASHMQARPAPSRSPRVKASSQPRPGAIRVKRTYDSEESLPPVALLNSVRKSCALDVEPENALEFLRRYQDESGKSSDGWEQRLCAEYDIRPSTVTLLASILRRCNGKGQLSLAKKLMLSASSLGEKSATFEIISSAITTGFPRDYPAPLQRLGILAKKDNDPQAMTLLGKVLFNQRGEKEAMEWFRKATRPPTGSLDFQGAGDALVHEGRILLGWKDKKGAEAAFRKAALELDDPSAYFYLSQLQEPGSPNQEVYLLKAASSGVLEAWHNLGALELAKIEKRPLKDGQTRNYGMAKEWFEVAAADGFGLSMLNLASIYRAMGQEEEALRWLEKAEGAPDVREQAGSMRGKWRSASTKSATTV